jgi:transposase-like protein
MRGRAYSAEDDAAIIRMVSEGVTNVLIAAAIGRSESSLRSRSQELRQHGLIQLRGKGRPTGGDEWSEDQHREGDRLFIRALALAFQRGDNLPAMRRAA